MGSDKEIKGNPQNMAPMMLVSHVAELIVEGSENFRS